MTALWLFLAVLGAPLLHAPVWLAAVAFVAIAAVHAVLNVVGYAIGARAAPV